MSKGPYEPAKEYRDNKQRELLLFLKKALQDLEKRVSTLEEKP